jgi:hypothetical protein
MIATQKAPIVARKLFHRVGNGSLQDDRLNGPSKPRNAKKSANCRLAMGSLFEKRSDFTSRDDTIWFVSNLTENDRARCHNLPMMMI